MINNFFLFCILLAAISSCKPDPNSGDEPLCSSRSVNSGTALRLAGFFYFQSSLNPDRVSVYILNSNGTLGNTSMGLPLSNAQSNFSSSSFLNYISDNKSYWGVYHIEGSNIYIDTWHASSNGKDYGYRWRGEILSDSSFKIISSSRCNGSEFSSENKIYYFYPLESKPDSVTSLIP
jgi:hypothetical protein